MPQALGMWDRGMRDASSSSDKDRVSTAAMHIVTDRDANVTGRSEG
jgi:hypothetical protein